jgi:hypothetical protein
MDLAEIGLDGYELWFDDLTQQPEIWSNKTKKWISLGSKNSNGYIFPVFWANGKKTSVLLHRIVGLVCIPNPDSLKQIDHINGNKLDNRIENLRWCSNSTNAKNKPSTKGYSWVKSRQKWRAAIKIDGRTKFLGSFDTETEARAAYIAAHNLFFPSVRHFDE